MTRRASPPCVVVVDSREQLPLSPFVYRTRAGLAERESLPTITRGLPAGDYSVEGMEAWVAVERKSQPDLWGTIFGVDDEPTALGEARHHLDVFRAELHRMLPLPRKWLLIEGGKGSLMRYAQERYARARRRGRSPEQNVNSLLDILSSIEVDYGVPVVWAGGRDGAEAWLGRTFARLWSQATDGDKAATARRRGLTAAELPWLGAVTGEVAEEAAE